MSLYPSLEALLIDKEVKAQENLINQIAEASTSQDPQVAANYNALAGKYLGIDLSKVTYDEYGNPYYNESSSGISENQNTAVVPVQPTGPIVASQSLGAIVPSDPVTVSQGVREIFIKKNSKGYVGLQLKNQDAGVFVIYVEDESPAALAGLRFGDQILKVQDKYVAGMKGKEVMNFISKKCDETFSIAIRDRPLERVISLAKDSHGSIGIIVKNGAIESIVKGSSAERNGVLINSHICEIEGINVLGVKDKRISELIQISGPVVKVTVIPEFYFENLSKKLGRSQFKMMDRSLPII